jgi:hypothetical protein
MNTGSNHVGVAAAMAENPNTKQADTEQKSSTLAHDWPKASQEDTKMTKTKTSIELQTAWTKQFANSSAPDVDEFAPADRDELIELIAELDESRKDISRLHDGGAQLNADFEVATQALADLDAGKRVYRADDDDGAWFLTL